MRSPNLHYYNTEVFIYYSFLLSPPVKLGGMLKRQNSTVRIDLRTVENSVLLMVEDHGCGINEHTLPHIFEKFYRGDKSRSFEGNGLGLALVKRIVALCQGEITVENKLHQGTFLYGKTCEYKYGQSYY